MEIPRLFASSPKASHAVVACNEEGDIYVVWSGRDAVTNLTQVEGAFLRRQNNDRWQLFDTQVLASGLASGGHCINPDVIAVDEDFVVAWTWMNPNSIVDGEIRCAFVEVSDQNNVEFFPANQQGYTLADMNPRLCNGMVDLAVNEREEIVASYVSFSGNGTGAANYNFSVEAVVFEFNGSSTVGPPQKSASQELLRAIPFDEIFAGENTVGRVLPGIVFEKRDKLVLACEAFLDADRAGISARQSAIHLSSYKLKNQDLTLEKTILVSSTGISAGSTKIQQRPALVKQGRNKMLLTWVEHKGNADSNQGVASFASTVELTNSGFTLAPAQLDSIDPRKTREYVVPMQYEGPSNPDNYAVRSVRDKQGNRVQKLHLTQGASWEDIVGLTPANPWRPAVDAYLDSNPFGVISVEGRDTQSTEMYQRIYLLVE